MKLQRDRAEGINDALPNEAGATDAVEVVEIEDISVVWTEKITHSDGRREERERRTTFTRRLIRVKTVAIVAGTLALLALLIRPDLAGTIVAETFGVLRYLGP